MRPSTPLLTVWLLVAASVSHAAEGEDKEAAPSEPTPAPAPAPAPDPAPPAAAAAPPTATVAPPAAPAEAVVPPKRRWPSPKAALLFPVGSDGRPKGLPTEKECLECDWSPFPRFQIWWGGGFTNVADPGWGTISSDDILNAFQMGVELFPHERIAGSFAFSVSPWYYGAPDSTNAAETQSRWGTLEGSAKVIATPPTLPVRAYGRVGAGAWVGEVDIDGGDLIDHREFNAGAGFLLVGLGGEFTSPRRIRYKDLRFGGGLFVEFGARLGGGGDEVAAPSLDFGKPGRMDIGPWYYRAGALVFF